MIVTVKLKKTFVSGISSLLNSFDCFVCETAQNLSHIHSK